MLVGMAQVSTVPMSPTVESASLSSIWSLLKTLVPRPMAFNIYVNTKMVDFWMISGTPVWLRKPLMGWEMNGIFRQAAKPSAKSVNHSLTFLMFSNILHRHLVRSETNNLWTSGLFHVFIVGVVHVFLISLCTLRSKSSMRAIKISALSRSVISSLKTKSSILSVASKLSEVMRSSRRPRSQVRLHTHSPYSGFHKWEILKIDGL